jgi:hypothetical protein
LEAPLEVEEGDEGKEKGTEELELQGIVISIHQGDVFSFI